VLEDTALDLSFVTLSLVFTVPMIIAMFWLDYIHNKCSWVLYTLCAMAWCGGMA